MSESERKTISNPGALGSILGRRRRYVVDRKFQFRMGLSQVLGVVYVAVMLLAINLSLHSMNQIETESVAQLYPQLRGELQAMDRGTLTAAIAGSILALAGIFTLGVLRSHRTAGASLRLKRCLEQFAAGRYDIRASLRQRDDLGELADAFNAMAEAVETRTREELHTLESLSESIGKIEAQLSDTSLPAQLSSLITAKKRELQEADASTRLPRDR